FVWHAYGQALSAGGGYTAYPDPHARHSLSHNVILVNGSGQEWNPKAPKRPFCGRLLAYREGAGFVHWAGDATYAYQTVPGLLRWHRHVVFVDGTWFAVYDDLAMAPDADPARFSWLFHVAPDVPLDVDAAGPALRYRMGDVHALVALAGPADAIEVADLQLRDGFRNPITGHDMYEETAAALVRKGRTLPESSWMRHNVWITNREPARQWSFLTALVAWREGDTQPRVSFGGSARVTVGAGAGERTVSFDPRRPGDVTIDLEGVREHASRAR
ncbi:MAG: heparinase II/III family protein, partial [Lentisphaeria bacterium]|nr:heparinase II/III family protein [Lentisphaeria bacterium]